MLNDLTLVTCNYNTPDLILNLLKSVYLISKDIPKVLVMNTSTDGVSHSILEENGIPFVNCNGMTHGEAVNLAFEKVTTRYILLVDSDVIFISDFITPFEYIKSKQFVSLGKVVGDVGGKKLYPRIEPWYCFIDLQQLNGAGIKFFDSERTANSKISGDRIYDIGSTMFEDVGNCNMVVGNANLEHAYFIHYGGMSWRVQRYNADDKDTDIDFGGTHPNKELYEYGLLVRDKYLKDIERFKDIDIKNIFNND